MTEELKIAWEKFSKTDLSKNAGVNSGQSISAREGEGKHGEMSLQTWVDGE